MLMVLIDIIIKTIRTLLLLIIDSGLTVLGNILIVNDPLRKAITFNFPPHPPQWVKDTVHSRGSRSQDNRSHPKFEQTKVLRLQVYFCKYIGYKKLN
jgi:hypothetical protein